MENKYEISSRLLRNLRLSSDSIDMPGCYSLCASKQHIESMKTRDHQVIWGRRGTGKTTLLKAFTFDINKLSNDPNTVAIYIVMAKVVPTTTEIERIAGNVDSLALYVFSKLILEISDKIEELYNLRSKAMKKPAINRFLTAYFQLQDYLLLYQTHIQGGEISIDSINSKALKKEVGHELKAGATVSESVIDTCLKIINSKNRASESIQRISISGTLSFALESRVVGDLIIQMLDALGIELMYICLDEYSEIDKVSEYSIQSKVAQLIKQVFFKNPMYSVKIATIWNKSKLHTRGEPRVEGIEYQQDIFAGPDLDIMFMESNIEVVSYFKELLVNTYLSGEERKKEEKEALSDYIETNVFSNVGLRHLICGSQGVSRAFVVLAKVYLERLTADRDGVVKLGEVYEIIKHQYLEDVRSKVPYYSVYRAIDTFVCSRLSRYFLIKRNDYYRCKSLILYLSARGVFMQMPGHLTDRLIRDDYKLFVIHYGNYLDALESDSKKRGRKTLEEDSRLEANGSLIPEYSQDLINKPDDYTINLGERIENEAYCSACGKMYIYEEEKSIVHCKNCGKEILRFSEFLDEVSL